MENIIGLSINCPWDKFFPQLHFSHNWDVTTLKGGDLGKLNKLILKKRSTEIVILSERIF